MDLSNSFFSDYLNNSGGVSYDTTAGVNLPAANATSPIITNSNGTSAPSTSLLGFLSGLTQTAAQVFTSANTQATQNQIAARTTAATQSTAQSKTMIYLALGGVALLVGLLVLIRRK